MRLAGPRCPSFLLVAAVLATALAVSLAAVIIAAGPARAALTLEDSESVAPLTVVVDRSLSSTDEAVALTIEGRLARSIEGAKLVVRVKGPATVAQIGESAPELVETDKIVKVLGEETPSTTTSSTTTSTTVASVTSTSADLEAGVLNAKVILKPGVPAEPGAYLLVVEVKSGQEVWASGQVWVGKAAVRETPLDIAFVWPASLGIHRDADVVYYDRVLEEAVTSDTGALRTLLGLSTRFADWHFSMAIEPVLLTQIRDMVDGYALRDESGHESQVGGQDAGALSAGATLEAFKSLAAMDSVDIVAGPYSGADLGVLAAQGWRDGFEQIQMGKQEIQQTLGLTSLLTGACSPNLSLTTDSLAYYAQASIDHVVVSSELTGLLTEQIEDGTVAVRARDAENDRVTLVFANAALGSALAGRWDVGAFSAVLAAELTATPWEAIVVAPGQEFTIPPATFLSDLGRMLEATDWVNTQTLTELLRAHSAGTRPVLLKTGAVGTQGYIERSLLTELEAAHAAVTDLAAITDATRTPVETAHRLLYVAESRWWSRAGTSPTEASIGLEYSRRALETARGELDKIRFVGLGPTTVTGGEGVVGLEIENGTDYPVTVGLRLVGTGITLPGGEGAEIEVPPGRSTIEVQVAAADGPRSLAAELVAGGSILDQVSEPLRFVTIGTVLPALIVGGMAVLAGVCFLVRWYLRKRRVSTPAPPKQAGKPA